MFPCRTIDGSILIKHHSEERCRGRSNSMSCPSSIDVLKLQITIKCRYYLSICLWQSDFDFAMYRCSFSRLRRPRLRIRRTIYRRVKRTALRRSSARYIGNCARKGDARTRLGRAGKNSLLHHDGDVARTAGLRDTLSSYFSGFRLSGRSISRAQTNYKKLGYLIRRVYSSWCYASVHSKADDGIIHERKGERSVPSVRGAAT